MIGRGGAASDDHYDDDTLKPANVEVADGSEVPVWNATAPVGAHLVGLPRCAFELRPMFLPGRNVQVLWGRADFFTPFRLAFEEADRRFSLTVA